MTAQDIVFPIEQGADWAFSFVYGTPTPFAPWSIGVTHSLNDVICPTGQGVPVTRSANGLYYRCVVAGASGSSQPAWTVIPGQTTVDGAATWICQTNSTVPVNLTGAAFEMKLKLGRRSRTVFLELLAGVTPTGITNGGASAIVTLSIYRTESALMIADAYAFDFWIIPSGSPRVKAMTGTFVVSHSTS